MEDTFERNYSLEVGDVVLIEEGGWGLVDEDENKYVEELYEGALSMGIAKEVARVILPEGLTMSRMYMNGTLRSWLHYGQLRDGNGTQLEHIDVAKKSKNEIVKVFPFMERVFNNG